MISVASGKRVLSEEQDEFSCSSYDSVEGMFIKSITAWFASTALASLEMLRPSFVDVPSLHSSGCACASLSWLKPVGADIGITGVASIWVGPADVVILFHVCSWDCGHSCVIGA